MKKLMGLPAAVTAGVTAAVLAAGLAVPAASAALAAAKSQGSDGGQASPGNMATAVTLLNGVRLAAVPPSARTGPGGVVSGTPGASAGGILSLRVGSAAYEVPYDAIPYLGRGLDPALFTVSALLREEKGGRLPVRVVYHGHAPVLPGVTITSAAAGTATGYLTATSAKLFGAALARQYVTDHAHASYGRDGLFGGGVSISLPGSPPGAARPALRPHPAPSRRLRFRTLTVNGKSFGGFPDTGDDVLVFNVDNSRLFGGLNGATGVFENGITKFSVPAGHYMLVGMFPLFATDGTIQELMLPVQPQVTVSRDTTVTLDARAANSQVMMVTPRPAIAQDTTFDLHRTPVTGPMISLGAINFGAPPVLVNPVSQPVTVGHLQTFSAQYLVSPKSAAKPYSYDLNYQNPPGIIPPQRFVVHPASLATMVRRFFSASPMNTAIEFNGLYRPEFGDFIVVELLFTQIPAAQTLYLTASPSLEWFSFLARLVPEGGPFPGIFFFDEVSNVRTYPPGQRIEDWNGYPLHPVPDVNVPGAMIERPLVASANRAGNVLNMSVTPFSDNTPGHLGVGFGTGAGLGSEPGVAYLGRFTVDQDGVQVASGDATKTLAWHATLRPQPSTIQFTLDATRVSKGVYPLSPHSHTAWTWRSAAAPGATLPRGWVCGYSRKPGRACAAQPLLSLAYHVAGLSLTGQTPAGQQKLTISVSHFQPASTTAAITKVAVQVSFDGGTTWHPATVTGSGGNWAATFTAPAGAAVTLRTSAADAAGGSVDETITSAYQTAS
ncbi:MAG TPA: hypothetical protein VGS19_24115 [Streptosporangiaceae bacterium]|nr:hypothetical protein [Streptosporangiaceae bacterium]